MSVLIATAGGPVTVTNTVYTAVQSLTTLLTTESLLFAAFNAGVVLTMPGAAPRRITARQAGWIATICVGILAAVATAAALAWWQVFGDHWPGSSLRATEGLGIAVGIVCQPIVAGIVAWSNGALRRL